MGQDEVLIGGIAGYVIGLILALTHDPTGFDMIYIIVGMILIALFGPALGLFYLARKGENIETRQYLILSALEFYVLAGVLGLIVWGNTGIAWKILLVVGSIIVGLLPAIWRAVSQ